jgi:elongator complex protein 3
LRITDNWAIIRELHTYGRVVPIKAKSKKAAQHKGLGKKLMKKAEKIVATETNFKKIAVISGIGVREYYRKLGYKLRNEYMVKKLTNFVKGVK